MRFPGRNRGGGRRRGNESQADCAEHRTQCRARSHDPKIMT